MLIGKHYTIARNITSCVTISHCYIKHHPYIVGVKMKTKDLSKTYRIRGEFVEVIRETSVDFIVETKERIEEADVVNALIYKYLHELKAKDVTKYIEDIKKKG